VIEHLSPRQDNCIVTRKDIIRTIANQLGLTQIQASQIVHKLLDAIVNTLVEEGRVELRNFGVFEVRRRKARKARNPRSGEQVMVPAKCAVTFKPGQRLEERVESESRTAAASGKTQSKAKSSLGVGTARPGD
jgi:integration host factor subunit beta